MKTVRAIIYLQFGKVMKCVFYKMKSVIKTKVKIILNIYNNEFQNKHYNTVN